jgi:peroxin-6
MLYLGVSDTHDAQLKILGALTRKFRLDPGLDLRSVAEKCPFDYTGADFYALCSDAMLSAMTRKAEAVEQKIGKLLHYSEFKGQGLTQSICPAILNAHPIVHRHPHPITPQYYLAELASMEDIEVLVTARDFDQALRSLVPSVSQAEMEHYAQVQKRFSEDLKGPVI